MHKIVIDSENQSLKLLSDGKVLFEAPISTSRFGLGFENGSGKTPVGKFRIYRKIGAGAPVRTVFKGRVPVTEPVDWSTDENLITTRILWLDGLEERNAETRNRYIYIHGTNHEDKIGRPASGGCIQMRNNDIVELFDQVLEGAPVEILGVLEQAPVT